MFQTNIEIDWDPKSREEYTCDGGIITPVSQLCIGPVFESWVENVVRVPMLGST